MNVEDAAFELQDALRDDFSYLQPPEEHRFDPVTVGFTLGLLLLTAIGNGIVAGVQEAVKDQTKTVVIAVGTAVKQRIQDYLKHAFEPKEAGQQALDQRQKEAEQSITAAQGELRQLPIEDPDKLDSAIANAVREGLQEQRLPQKPGERVEKVVRSQVLILITQTTTE